MVGGLGLAGLAVGSVAGANAIGARGEIEDLGCNQATLRCPTDFATERAQAHSDRGSDLATVSSVAFVTGGVLLAAGAGILIVDSAVGWGSPKASAAVAPAIGLGSGGASIRGAF
jgi:hypothetical protein